MDVDGQRQWSLRQRFALEISTFLYFISKNSAIPLVQQYVYLIVARKYNFTELHNADDDQCHLTSPDYAEIQAIVNEESSLTVLYLNIAELLPSAVVVLMLGRWSDVTGKRKVLMWLPCLGNAIYALGFILPAYIDYDIYSSNSMSVFYVATVICGLSGNLPGFLSGNGAYISDTDSRERRTLRLAIVEFTIGITFAFSSLGLGFWVYHAGFIQPLWFVFATSLCAMVVIIFGLREPTNELDELGGQRAMRLDDLKSLKDIFRCRTLAQKKLWCVFVAFQIYVFVQQGQERTFVLYLQNPPVCWNAVKIGLFLFTLMLLSGLACWPGVPLLHRCNVSDITIAFISIISKIAGSITLAFARNDATVFTASAVQLFHLAPYAVARSVVSKQAGVEDQGAIYGITHCVQAVVTFLGPVLHNAVYAGTLWYMKGCVFLISGVLLGVPLGLLIGFKYLDKKEDEYWSIGGHTDSEMQTPLSESSSLRDRDSMDIR